LTPPHPLFDDLGEAVPLSRPPRRVVSLVPSLTESVAVSAPEILVGATDWCTHPARLDVARVRGTKNPNRSAIEKLRPDLVLANKEENRRVDVNALRAAGIAVWVTAIETVEEAITSLSRLFIQALQRPIPGWLEDAGRAEPYLVWAVAGRRPRPAQQPDPAGSPFLGSSLRKGLSPRSTPGGCQGRRHGRRPRRNSG
jgi:hypothetical protein